jgi:predicted dehydrogenase
MKQVIQSARTGRLELKDVPEPKVRPGHILVRTRASLISAGTERMTVAFARKSFAAKAQARPDLVKKVLAKARRDGLKATVRAVLARLDEPLPLGYSAAGDVVAVGQGLEGVFRVGERVAVAGAGLANHAELNVIPRNLAAPVPAGVTDEQACFATLGAIALHAARNARPGLGDVVAVVGVGLVGQLAAQFLTLAGARVLALDYDAERLALAKRLGAEAARDLADGGLAETVAQMTQGRGCDAIVIAAATDSSEPFATAAAIARDRARVVVVGKTGTEFPYTEFMKKELAIVASRAYGPGRYDADFEARGLKYPEGWVRWTETENLAETLRLMAPATPRRLDVVSLVSHRFPFAEAETAYGLVTGDEPHLGVVLTYPETAEVVRPAFPAPAAARKGACALGVIGAGQFARSVLLPELRKIPGVELHTLATQRGASADHGRETFGFKRAAADEAAVLDNPAIDAIVIATRHDSHAELAARALGAGKAVLVEKPLALTLDDLNKVIAARNRSSAFFQVGFNRRFAPLALKLRDRLKAAAGPKVVLLRVNAGALPAESWVHDAESGGGRILGEVCHFVDLARFFVGAPIMSVTAEAARPTRGAADDATVALRFADGSLATIAYTARGDERAGKERYEAHAGGVSLVLDNFHALVGDDRGRGSTERAGAAPDKGFHGQLRAFVEAARRGGPAPVDEAELIETSAAAIAVMESLRAGQRIDL